MNACARASVIKILIPLAGWFMFTELPLAVCAAVRRDNNTMASTRTKDMVITIANADGRLRDGKENSFCVVFEQRATGEPMIVGNVRVDFRLLVGRIQEEPIRAYLAQDHAGRYCGQVNLGKQYYNPASYYAFVFYTDVGGKKRKTRLFLSVK